MPDSPGDRVLREVRRQFVSWFSPSTMWDVGMELGPSDLVASAFPCGTILLASCSYSYITVVLETLL